MARLEDILLPDIGDFANVEIIEILVAPGDRIVPEQSLLTLESDKASIDIPAPRAGLVRELLVAVGARVSRGAPLMRIETDAAPTVAESASPPPAPPPAPMPTQAQSPEAASDATGDEAARSAVEIRLPDIGDFKNVPVIEVLVKVGDRVAVDQSILTLESDKATMDIPAPRAGIVQALHVGTGDKLNHGDMLLTLRPDPSPAEPSRTAPAPAGAARAPGEAERRKAPVLPRPADMTAIATGRTPHASPAVRRFARELGVDLARVKGSGRKDRVLKDDVRHYVKQTLGTSAAPVGAGLPLLAPPVAPAVDFAAFGPIEAQPLSRIRRASGAHLHRCWLSIPHVTQFDEADITALEDFRNAQRDQAGQAGIKLSLLPFLLKTVAIALTRQPLLKASLSADGESLIHKHYCHIGVAVDTPGGLVVPVLRDVDRKGVFELARELAELSAKARAGKLLLGDMRGAVFSISSLGGIGGTAFTPIVNAPEVAILGVARATMRPVWDGAAFAPRLMLPLALSYDHRVVDGADGARFTTLLAGLLGDIRQLLL